MKYLSGKNSRKILQTVLCTLLLLTASMAAGCQKKSVEHLNENNTDDSADIGDGEDNISDGQPAGVDMPASISYVLEGDNEKPSYNIDAIVRADGIFDVGIYDVVYDKVDDAYLKNLAEEIFDDGEYDIAKPYPACTKNELLAEEMRLREIGESAGNMISDTGEMEPASENGNSGQQQYPAPVLSRLEALEGYIDSGMDDSAGLGQYYDECIMQEYSGIYDDSYRGSLLQAGYVDLSEKNADQTIYRAGMLRGSIDGIPCELNAWTFSCEEPYIEYRAYYNLTFLNNPVSIYGICALDDEAEERFEKNICDIDKAEQDAENMLGRLGLDQYVKAETLHVVTDSYGKQGLDGYCFNYVYAPDGITVNYMNSMYADYEYSGAARGCPCVRVYVNSCGVAYVSVHDPIELKEKKDAGELKSFSEIDDIARQTLTAGNTFSGEELTYRIYAVKLMYGIVTEDGANYELRPIWVYCGIDDGEYNEIHKCAVVAVDAVNGVPVWCDAALLSSM